MIKHLIVNKKLMSIIEANDMTWPSTPMCQPCFTFSIKDDMDTSISSWARLDNDIPYFLYNASKWTDERKLVPHMMLIYEGDVYMATISVNKKKVSLNLLDESVGGYKELKTAFETYLFEHLVINPEPITIQTEDV